MYSASDVLKFVNDRAYEQAFRTVDAVESEKIETLLAFLDSTEMFLEVGSLLVGGEKAKWIAVSIVQLLKCSWRAIYVAKKKRVLTRPILDAANRQELQKNPMTSGDNFSLPRSGRTMRIVPDSGFQDRKLWNVASNNTKSSSKISELGKQQILAELSFILQPIVHLTSLGFFGLNSWMPWALSLVCDLSR